MPRFQTAACASLAARSRRGHEARSWTTTLKRTTSRNRSRSVCSARPKALVGRPRGERRLPGLAAPLSHCGRLATLAAPDCQAHAEQSARSTGGGHNIPRVRSVSEPSLAVIRRGAEEGHQGGRSSPPHLHRTTANLHKTYPHLPGTFAPLLERAPRGSSAMPAAGRMQKRGRARYPGRHGTD